MHMSFAFGWFLLIVMGNVESRIYSGWWINPPYYPIFMKFFIHDKRILPFEIFTIPGFLRFSMDLILLFILTGLVMAVIKRKRSKWFGVNKTTHLQLSDKVAMTCLWLIFPLRLMAESFTDGAFGYGGGFVTQHLGNFIAMLIPISDKIIAYGFWWLYSLSLGIFFVTLPYSRYMHIPTEVLLILFRNFGIKAKKEYSSFSEVEIYSCSRCGVCIDACQLATSEDVNNMQSVYFIRSVRNRELDENALFKCMICGRCTEACPVGINIDSLRLIKRKEINRSDHADHSFLKSVQNGSTGIIYFAGCMSHLTPGIIHAMKGILEKAGIDYWFMDEKETICCGRPMMLSGKEEQAKKMMEINRKAILDSGAEILVASCPICYRVFKEEYRLPIRIQHHSEFLLDLVRKGKIPLQGPFKKIAYHDPCDLGRGTSVYNAPRELLSKMADLVHDGSEKINAPCCGGSLGALTLDQKHRDEITKNALKTLLEKSPDLLITACPLCKKTFRRHAQVGVLDIAEMVYESIPGNN